MVSHKWGAKDFGTEMGSFRPCCQPWESKKCSPSMAVRAIIWNSQGEPGALCSAAAFKPGFSIFGNGFGTRGIRQMEGK